MLLAALICLVLAAGCTLYGGVLQRGSGAAALYGIAGALFMAASLALAVTALSGR